MPTRVASRRRSTHAGELKLPRYETATPDRIWQHFLDATGTLHITEDAVTCALNMRSHHPVPDRRRLRRPRNPHPLAGRPHTAVPDPATRITSPQGTSTQLPDRAS